MTIKYTPLSNGALIGDKIVIEADPRGVSLCVLPNRVYVPVNHVFQIKGIDDPVWYLISAHPNGIVYMDSLYSVPHFDTWQKLIKFTGLWDAISNGWLIVK